MYSLLATSTFSVVAATLGFLGFGLLKNRAHAKSSGFEYVLLPTNLTSVPWLIAGSLFLPLLDLLPKKRREQWMPLLLLDRIWHSGYRPFAITGADTLIAVSPTQNVLFTCDPKLITQLLRDPAFGKPTALLGLLNTFGPTLTGTDGPENKLYRKIIAPYFNQTTMDQVFRDTVEATKDFLQTVENQVAPVDSQLRPMLSKLALHILSKAGFGKEGSCLNELEFSEKPPTGHKLSFADTFLGIDQDLPIIALTPPALLKNSPLDIHKRGHLLRSEMTQYLDEAVEQTNRSSDEKEARQKNLLQLLVDAGGHNGVLSKEQITGNIFILHFAGHESNAHALQFALLHLACRPDLQTRVQADIDRILGNNSQETWSYMEHYPALSQSMVGAVLNESLRVYTVLPLYMKETKESPVTVNVDGRHHVIPPNTMIVVNTSATHRNPAYWRTPTGTNVEGAPYAVSAFDPDQWFDAHGKFLVPEPGSYIPFSDGPRGCIGQRFAMVELCVSLAIILKDHNIELAVDGEDDGEGSKWKAARDHAFRQLSGGIQYNMTLRIGGKVPVRFTKRG
ncbi:hypothetical protein E8E14_000853 [Neopestalotiopsis sp. 37M]|nr:hypothetical protein E8E14_000853 [Neopestalotiopsis sp. 37M]